MQYTICTTYQVTDGIAVTTYVVLRLGGERRLWSMRSAMHTRDALGACASQMRKAEPRQPDVDVPERLSNVPDGPPLSDAVAAASGRIRTLFCNRAHRTLFKTLFFFFLPPVPFLHRLLHADGTAHPALYSSLPRSKPFINVSTSLQPSVPPDTNTSASYSYTLC